MTQDSFSENNFKSCDLCGSKKSSILLNMKNKVMTSDQKIIGGHIKKVECTNCGLIRNGVKHKSDFFKQRYEKNYEYNTSSSGDVFFFTADGNLDRGSHAYDWIRTFLSTDVTRRINSILEIGCGEGNLILKFKQNFPNKKIIGLEVNKQAISVGRKKGLDIRSMQNHGNIKADLIISYAVIEHTLSPKHFLKYLQSFLNPGGYILLGTPHQDRIYYDIFFADHLYHFTTSHLRQYAKLLGLVCIKQSKGVWPINSFSLSLLQESSNKVKPTIIYSKTRVATSIKYYNRTFRIINNFLNDRNNVNKLAVFGLGEVFSLFFAYSNLKKKKILYGIDDFPKSKNNFHFPIIPSNEIARYDISSILVCVNKSYYDMILKKIPHDKYRICLPLR